MRYIIKIITGYIFSLSIEKKLKIDITIKIPPSRLIAFNFFLMVEYIIDLVFTIVGFHNSFSTSFLLISNMHHATSAYIMVYYGEEKKK